MSTESEMLELTSRDERPAPRSHNGTVQSVSGTTAEVMLDGGESSTTCKTVLVECHVGNRVIVQIDPDDRAASVIGNITEPSASSETVKVVQDYAQTAGELVDEIERIAEDAGKTKDQVIESMIAAGEGVDQIKEYVGYADDYTKTLAEKVDEGVGLLSDMKEAATAAGTTLTGIYEDAETAKRQVGEAKEAATQAAAAASDAVRGLSTVEDVVDALAWIQRHGRMDKAKDAAIDPAHVYYVQDPDGSVVVGNERYSQVAEPDEAQLGDYYELTVDKSVYNYIATHVALTDDGLYLTPNELDDDSRLSVVISTGGRYEAGTHIIDRNGAIVASFCTGGIKFGDDYGNHVLLDDDSFDIYHGNMQTVHFGYGEALNREGELESAPYYSLGGYSPSGQMPAFSGVTRYHHGAIASHDGKNYICIAHDESGYAWNPDEWAEIANGYHSFAEGGIANAPFSHAEGYLTAACGQDGHSEGTLTVASGDASHAEGFWTTASGPYSHAEGFKALASGFQSHAEGNDTKAIGISSHAEGEFAFAEGWCSHAQNYGTKAASDFQTAIGKFNVVDDKGVYAFIIGNGTDASNRSNALAVRKDGLIDQAGQTAYPTYMVANIRENGIGYEPPVKPCMVYETSTDALYWVTE